MNHNCAHQTTQLFVIPPPLQWVRFLKLRIVSLWGGTGGSSSSSSSAAASAEPSAFSFVYCTLTSIEIFGQTMLQNLESGADVEALANEDSKPAEVVSPPSAQDVSVNEAAPVPRAAAAKVESDTVLIDADFVHFDDSDFHRREVEARANDTAPLKAAAHTSQSLNQWAERVLRESAHA